MLFTGIRVQISVPTYLIYYLLLKITIANYAHLFFFSHNVMDNIIIFKNKNGNSKQNDFVLKLEKRYTT